MRPAACQVQQWLLGQWDAGSLSLGAWLAGVGRAGAGRQEHEQKGRCEGGTRVGRSWVASGDIG